MSLTNNDVLAALYREECQEFGHKKCTHARKRTKVPPKHKFDLVKQKVEPNVVTMDKLLSIVDGIAIVVKTSHLSSMDLIERGMDRVQKQLEGKNEENEKRQEAKNVESEKRQEAKNIESEQRQEARNVELKSRLASLEEALGKVVMFAASKQEKSGIPKLPRNVMSNKGTFSWRKMINNRTHFKGSYKTIAEAQEGLALFCKEHAAQATASIIRESVDNSVSSIVECAD